MCAVRYFSENSGKGQPDLDKDLYKTLGVESDANPKEVREAFLQKARDYHPDKRPECLEYFTHVTKAYETLSETHWSDNTNNSFTPNYFEKLSIQNIETKKKSFLRYKSQVKNFPHPRSLKGIEVLANFRGMNIGAKYAESFEIKRDLN